MKYIINYNKDGKILGFAKGDTGLNIEVSNNILLEAQSFNKILIDGETISFDKVDWRTAEEIEAEQLAEAKRAKLFYLDTIVVTVNYNEFDGNDKARLNMLSAIQSAEVVGIDKTYWKLADNTVAEVTVGELKQALAKAIQRVGEIVV